MTLWALGVRQCSGQLTLRAEGKKYCIVFDHGAVVGATSPLASDSAARVALIHHLIAPAQVADLTRRIAAAPEREEIEVLTEAARLTLDQALRLRRKVIEQRAARTFSVDAGELVIDSDVDLPIVTGLAIDVRSVIYLGARMNLSEQRLRDELRSFGIRFVLRSEAAAELAHFGLTATEQPVVDALRAGTSLAELEARHRDLDPRTAQAVIYALASCGLCTGTVPASRPGDAGDDDDVNDFSLARRARSAAPSETYSRTHTGRDVFVARPPNGAPRLRARLQTAEGGTPRPQILRAPAGGADEAGVPRSPAGGARAAAPAIARAHTPSSPPPVATARAPTPGSLPRARSPGSGGPRQRTSSTFPVPPPSLDGSDPSVPPPDPIAVAKEVFKRAQSRLRVENLEDAIADLTRAVELAPNEVDYAATLAWARFCHAKDKQTLAQATREALGRAIRKSPAPELARFYLGRVERMLGRDREALRHFHEVLEAQPRHADAAAEVRVIEARMAQAAAKESGVFGRKR